MRGKGFTLIEGLIVLAILGIIISIAIPALQGKGGQFKDHTCVGGYKFTYQGKQIIGQNGGGIPCNDSVPSGATYAPVPQ